MEADLHSHVAFYLTGKRLSSQLDAIDTLKLRPALFSGYRDLTGLRYDFPLILVDKPDQGEFVVTLSGVIDGILNKIARGNDAERIRKHVLRLEQAIRCKVAEGVSGTLTTLWDQAAEPLTKADKLVMKAYHAPVSISRPMAKSSIVMPACPTVCLVMLGKTLNGNAH